MEQDNLDDMEQFFTHKNKVSYRPKSIQFCFPQRQFQSIEFNSIKQVDQYLEASENFRLFSKKVRGDYYYLKCKLCTARASFYCKSPMLRLIKFQNHHLHQSTKNKLAEEEMVIQLLKQSVRNQSPKEAKLRILRVLSISSRRYNYVLEKYFDKNSFELSMRHLEENNYYVKIKNSQSMQLPELILLMSKQMKRWATKYCDVFTFDITYHLLKARSKQNKQWGLGVFTTFDSNLSIIPIAFALILHETTETFVQLFRGFLELVQSRTCTFVTDDQKAISSALTHLNQAQIFYGNHLLDDFHTLRNIKSKVGQKEFPFYAQLIRTKYPHKFDVIYEELCNRTKYPEVLQTIYQRKQKLCFSQGRQKFVGFSYSTSRGEKCNDLIKSLVPKQTNIYRLIFALEKLEDKIMRRQTKFEIKKYQKLFQDSRILAVRERVEVRIFHAFLKNYIIALRMVQEKTEEPTIFLVETYRTSGDDCECSVSIKTGIPCAHMLAVLIRQSDSNYLRHFNWRWLELHKFDEELVKNRRGPRNSRRRKR